jgi:hypothetical protein
MLTHVDVSGGRHVAGGIRGRSSRRSSGSVRATILTIYVSSYYYILLLQVADMSLVAYASTAQDEAAEACVRAAFKQLPQGTPYATTA